MNPSSRALVNAVNNIEKLATFIEKENNKGPLYAVQANDTSEDFFVPVITSCPEFICQLLV